MLPKSSHKLNRLLFGKLFLLTSTQKWLLNKYAAVEHVIELADCIEEQDLLIDLLNRFVFIEASSINSYLDNIEDYLSSTWKLQPNSTFIAPLHNSKDPYADSSQLICQSFKANCRKRNIWPMSRFLASVPLAVQTYGLKSLVLVDEFIGTGTQALGVLNYISKIKAERNLVFDVYLISLAAMIASKSVVDSRVHAYHAMTWLGKGISDYFPSQEIEAKISHMRSLESKLLQTKGSDELQSLGHGQSETIFKSEMGTTADNVFPIFHWPWLKDGAVRPTILESRI